jgi:hypothetical protein
MPSAKRLKIRRRRPFWRLLNCVFATHFPFRLQNAIASLAAVVSWQQTDLAKKTPQSAENGLPQHKNVDSKSPDTRKMQQSMILALVLQRELRAPGARSPKN